MRLFEEFKINGSPIPVPDAEVELSYQDLDAGSAGRDESGVMHRIRVRTRVKTWGFQYFALSRETFSYLEYLLSEQAVFTFTYPDTDGTLKTCPAYCAKTSLVYENAKLGLYRNYKFSIIEC